MAIDSEILDKELLTINGSAVSESDRDALITACDSAISNWSSLPSLIQHIMVIIDHLDTPSADEIAACVAEDSNALIEAITAHTDLGGANIAYLTQRAGLITWASNITHN